MSLLQKRLDQITIEQEPERENDSVPKSTSKKALWKQIKEKVLKKVIDSIDLEELEEKPEAERSKLISEHIGVLVTQTLSDLGLAFTRPDYLRIVGEINSEITGYGPITPLIEDKNIDEIMVNGPTQVYVERKGRLVLTDVTFRDETHLRHVIERIIAPLGKRLDESSPMVDARLPNGSRVNATIPPVSIDGPSLTIRKFSETPLSMSDFIRFGTISTDMALFLKACVEGKLNIVVSGGTGSGKTTTLNVLSSFIPAADRIITIEDAAELHLQQEHIVRMEARPPNIEGHGRISIRDLVINSLRMRPDRIVVGEVRGGEALDMLQAMNTGHDGSLTTGHANSPRDLLARLETMVMMAGVELPMRAIREQVASAVQLIVHQRRLQDGSRKITNITEVLGMEGDVIILQDIFVFEQKGTDSEGKVKGSFRGTCVMPQCMSILESKGIHVPTNIFF